jgi:hypothetical protein
MSTFMEHIHRDTDTPPVFDDTAVPRPVEHGRAPSEGSGVRQRDAPKVSTVDATVRRSVPPAHAAVQPHLRASHEGAE